MPIPYRKHDMKKIAEMVDRDMAGLTEEDCERIIQESYARSEAERKAWLSYYDDSGHLKAGAREDPGFVPNRTYPFLAMSQDERAAFIVAEKKRMGLL